MRSSFPNSSFPSFNVDQVADSIWSAMNQAKSTFDKKVVTRMGRGDVRASILTVLADKPMHGYQIIRQIELHTEGAWKPSAGSVYPTLQMLADEGLVTSEMQEDRKVYSLTDAGREEADKVKDKTPWAEDSSCERPHVSSAVPKAGAELAQAVAHAMRSSKSEQHDAVAEVLHEARRKIYAILAQD